MVEGSEDFYVSVSLSSSNTHVITDMYFFSRQCLCRAESLVDSTDVHISYEIKGDGV